MPNVTHKPNAAFDTNSSTKDFAPQNKVGDFNFHKSVLFSTMEMVKGMLQAIEGCGQGRWLEG